MSDFDNRLHAFRRRFVEQAGTDADQIEAHAAADAWEAVRDISHGLAGRAGMFGFAALTEMARTLEEAVDVREGPDRLRALADTLVSDLRGLAAAG